MYLREQVYKFILLPDQKTVKFQATGRRNSAMDNSDASVPCPSTLGVFDR